MDSYHLRLAVEKDLFEILDIVKLVVPLMQAEGNYQWSESYPGETDFINDIKNRTLWVAVDASTRILGFCAITMDQGDDYKKIWDTSQESVVPHRLATHPAFKRMGVAKSLLSKAEEIAKEKALKSIRIDTNQKNKATNTLFPQLGYHYVGDIGLTGREGLFSCYEKNMTDI